MAIAMENIVNLIPKIALAFVALGLLLGSGPGLAGQPPCTTSDAGNNTACGSDALQINAGTNNSAFGAGGLSHNTMGINNTASGAGALAFSTTGSNNAAAGFEALVNNTTGSGNTAGGSDALFSNTRGNNNTASGGGALGANTTGSENTASGAFALKNNTTGAQNTADGFDALIQNVTGKANTALGFAAGTGNLTGHHNTFLGVNAEAKTGGLTNATALGNGATLTVSNSIVLGDSKITRIFANVTSISALSDRRQKKDITALNPALGLAFIARLQPVSYRFNNGDETKRYGFIAQDLEQALPKELRATVETAQPEHGVALIERQNDAARTYRIAYGELIAPLVKAVQEEQQDIAALKSENARLRQALEDQAAMAATKTDALRQAIEALRKEVGAIKLAQALPIDR